MKILCLVYNSTDACSFYRAGGVFPELRRRNNQIETTVIQWNQIGLHWQNIIEFDLIYMQRPFSEVALNFVRFAKNFRVPLWADYDDNLFQVPAENKLYHLYGADSRDNIKNIAKLVDVISVTTPDLELIFKQFNNRVKLIPNAFNDFIFERRRLVKERSKIVAWRGSDGHIKDVWDYAQQLNETMKDLSWQFFYIGFYPWFLNRGKNLFNVEEMDIIFYHNYLADLAPSLLHVPLYQSPFNVCKSNIAYIEAAYAGAVCLAPAWPEWVKPGSLTYTTPVEYLDAMKAVMNGEIDIKKSAAEAWEYVTENLMLSEINELRMEVIEELI